MTHKIAMYIELKKLCVATYPCSCKITITSYTVLIAIYFTIMVCSYIPTHIMYVCTYVRMYVHMYVCTICMYAASYASHTTHLATVQYST